MPSAAEKPSIIEQYSQAFTCLKAGKHELIQWGAEAVKLNRFIVDEAENTGQSDATPILHAIDLSKVTHGNTEAERIAYCKSALQELVALQEEVVVLQKSAREKGISGGLLTIIGQAASQSPEDNGASVLRQLTDLVQGDESAAPVPSVSPQPTMASQTVSDTVSSDTPLDMTAANDIERDEPERMKGLQLFAHTLISDWKPLVVDISVCAIAAGVAISLIN